MDFYLYTMDQLITSKFAAKNEASNNHYLVGGNGWDNPISTTPSPYVPNQGDGNHLVFHPMNASSTSFGGGFNSSDGCNDLNGHVTHDNGHGTTITVDGSTSKCDGGHSNNSIGGGINYKNDNGGIGIEVHGGTHKGAGLKFDYQW